MRFVNSKLRQLLSEPLSQRSLRAIQSSALEDAAGDSEPLGYFVIGSIAGYIAEHDEGSPLPADVATIRDEVVRPALLTVLDAAEKSDNDRLVTAANVAINSAILSL